MTYLKLLLVFLFAGLLAACAPKTPVGTYQVLTGAMGVKVATGTAEFQKDRISLMGRSEPVAHWKREGNVVTAFDKDSTAVIKVREEEDGKTLTVLDLGAGMTMTLTRLD
jgi:hypothetical protein